MIEWQPIESLPRPDEEGPDPYNGPELIVRGHYRHYPDSWSNSMQWTATHWCYFEEGK